MTCWRHRSRRNSRTPAGRWRWTGRDLESFSRPPPRGTGDCADPEASWGHRKNNLLRSENELFFGYYLSAAVMMPDENGPAVPELARRTTLSSCRHDPVPRLRPRADRDARQRHPARRRPRRLRLLPPRSRGTGPSRSAPPARSSSRTCTPTTAAPRAPTRAPSSPTGTCTARPPRAPAGTRAARPRRHARSRPPRTTRKTAEPARYKLGRLTADDADGYHRVQCPAATGKIRCPLRPASMTLDRDRPEILQPPRAPPGLLHPADHHRPARRARQDRAETRLPVGRLAPLLRPPHRRRARLRHRQGPRHQRHQPRLVPPHGPGAPHAVHRHPARRPQPAHPRRLERPAGRKPAPRRRRAAPENPQTAPQDPRRARTAAPP